MSFKRKTKLSKFFSTKIGIAVILAVSFFIVSPVVKVYLKSRQATQMSEGVEQEIIEMQARKEFLEAEVARLKTPEGKEEEARKKFNIAKPDEEMIVITDKGAGDGSEDDNESGGLWQKIKNLF